MLESNMYCTIVTKMNKLNYLHIIKNNLYRCFSDVPQVYLQYIKIGVHAKSDILQII